MLRPIALSIPGILLALAACSSGSEDEPAATPGASAGATALDEHAGHDHAPGAHPPRALPEGIAAEVDGTPIRQSVLEERFEALLEQEQAMRGQALPPGMVEQARRSMLPQILEQLVSEQLADAEVARLGIVVADEEVREQVELSVEKHLLDNDLTLEEFAGRVREVQDLSFEEFIAEQVAAPTGRRFVAHGKWVQQLWPDEVEVTDADVRARYEAELAERLTWPEKVRASHILLLPDPEDEAGVLARAEELVALARVPEADFAALAREHSKCPSAPAGGDLGWFEREGSMVEEFAAAAYALEPGKVSDVVRTQFGFHVIRLTGRKPGRTIPFEEAADVLRYEIETERMTQALNAHVDELRAKAVVKYP